MARPPQSNGYGSSSAITSNTTISITLLITIVFGAVNAGILWARVEGTANTQRNDKLALQTSQDRTEKLMEELVRADVFAEKLALINAKFEIVEKTILAVIAEHKHLETNVVRRGEFDLRRESTNQTVTELTEQIIEVRKQVQDLFPPTKTYEEILKRLNRLEEIRLNHQRTEQKNSGPAS